HELRILFLGDNKIQGKLPYEDFQSWTSMKVANLTFDRDNVYMVAVISTPLRYFNYFKIDVIIMMGYGSGLINEIVIGNELTRRNWSGFSRIWKKAVKVKVERGK
ncbi:hypothetical protein CFP56_041819, partial [Quercus suber]